MHHKVHFKHDWMNILWEQKVPFFKVFIIVLASTYGVLYALDFYPEMKIQPSAPVVAQQLVTNTNVKIAVAPAPKKDATIVKTTSIDPFPTKLIIEKLDKTVPILNPTSNSVEALDAALLKGVARHPDSATFTKVGTMFILGHSSYLPIVHNKNYQALNGIQKLVWGDLVRIQSSDTEYLYRVEKVYQVKASLAEAEITWGKGKLIMDTCNSFGTKDDRFVVEAYLVKSYPIPSDAR
jgi:sortase (surface protein transpeptidase)